MNNPVKSPSTPSLFGRVSLGYVVVESRKLPEWRRFAQEGLGLHVDTIGDRALAMRIDDHQLRLLVRDGAAEDVVAFGWQLEGDDALHHDLWH